MGNNTANIRMEKQCFVNKKDEKIVVFYIAQINFIQNKIVSG